MSSNDFRSVQHQFSGHWLAIEQASPSERRVLVVELAKALAEWEAAQGDALDRIGELKRTGFWSTLAQITAGEIKRILDGLSRDKEALHQRLTETYGQIEEAESQIQPLTVIVDALRSELSVGEAQTEKLKGEAARLREELAACERLRDLRADLDRARMALDQLGGAVQMDADPSGMLNQIATLSATTMAYYETYLLATRGIATQLSAGGTAPPPLPEVARVPERLLRLDEEIKAIDRILAEQLRVQDAWDQEVKARA